MYVGQQGVKGEIYQRCTECGDSDKSKNSAHRAIYPDGATYCYRCGHSSQLSMRAMFNIIIGNTSIDEVLEGSWVDSDVKPTISERPTRLDVFTDDDIPGYNCFAMRTKQGDTVGWHNRQINSKRFHNQGKRGYGFVGDTIVSSPDRPIVLVEGQYDVIETHYVCVFGKLTKSTIKPLALHYCWLFPDYDCIDSKQKRIDFSYMCYQLVDEHMVFVQGAIVGDANDPDECHKLYYAPYVNNGIDWGAVNVALR